MSQPFSPEDFDYSFPQSQVAQHPQEPRDASRMLVLERGKAEGEDLKFSDFPKVLPKNALLVLNNTQVLPWRLEGRTESMVSLDMLLLELREEKAEAFIKKSRRLKPGQFIFFEEETLQAEVLEKLAGGSWLLRFSSNEKLFQLLEKVGRAPLPPYIKRKNPSEAQNQKDKKAYQTFHAQVPGSLAAPTAGLHFTARTFQALAKRGIEWAELTLEVGRGTFMPVKSARIDQHNMHSETYRISAKTAKTLSEAKKAKRPIVAVGTTVVRSLESWNFASLEGKPYFEGETKLFIYPPYSFQVVDSLITNFHQPKSTLLMLCAAFHGHEALLKAYAKAVEKGYRLFSFGDCMFIQNHPS